ncbi:hypothetical protein AB89_2082 [Escherichia coli 2-316-03_S3_C1]|nr:hypothetical protein AB89_2082 [Escherichia coli 2-316-03_S3_C1]
MPFCFVLLDLLWCHVHSKYRIGWPLSRGWVFNDTTNSG